MKVQTPLLADSLRNCLIAIRDQHNSSIAADLLAADKLIETYNHISKNNWNWTEEDVDVCYDLFNAEIAKYVNDEVRALSVRKDVFEIAFTPKGKELVYSNEQTRTWSRENRQTGKPGRIIRKVLVKDYKERDVELFSNQLKAELMDLGEFMIVSGDDICKWYDQDNYYKIAGTLGNSCMKYSSCQCFFEVYKDLAKMLICVKDGLLLGRAILWDIDGQRYMDRVYVCMDYLEEQFYQYAMDNKWTIRENNSLLYDENDQYWLEASDGYKNAKVLDITLQCKYKYDRFPYMDSFRYFDPETLTLYCKFPSFTTIWLSSTEGFYEEASEYTCPRCGETVRVYDEDDHPWYWSELLEEYICPDCAIWNDWAETYITDDTKTIDVITENGDTVEVPYGYVERDFTNYDEKSTFASFIHMNGNYYTRDAVVWDEILDRYILKND